ncbi:MAG: hypothetical protein KF870_06260 [Leadbetterella sp.]|nr:hypothetical protein [Leadbetterella sp.]
MKKLVVAQFLDDFKVKMKVWDIIFMDDRAKNVKTLSLLEISPGERKKIIEGLSLEDYAEGPVPDKQFLGDDLWVFGMVVKQQEIYIKISLGLPNKRVICVSFHVAEYPMKYPFKHKS